MAARKTGSALGGVALIVVCFVASAALRLGEVGVAVAEEIAAAPAAETAAPEPSESLLSAIREREAELDAEAARLAERAQALAVAEERLAEQLAAVEESRTQLEETLALADKAAERDIAQMTAVYEKMKPEEAAAIFAKMELSFAAGLLVRMKPEIAAQVLTDMEPDTAYAVTLMIASRHSRVPTE